MMMKIAAACTVACLITAPIATQAATTLVSADVHKPSHPVVQAVDSFAKALAEQTKGELVVDLKHSGQAGNENDVVTKLRKGELDMGRVNLAVLADSVPAAKLLSLPYLFRSRQHMWNALRGEFGNRLRAEIEGANLIALTYYDSGVRSFYSVKKPIRTRADFEGMRIRVQPSPVYQDLISQLGGTPVVLPYDKVLEALKTGEIDAAENNIPSYVSSEHYKYAKYFSIDEHSMVPEVYLMSKKRWSSLTPAQRELVLRLAEDSSKVMEKLWAVQEQEAMAIARKSGVTVIPKSELAYTGIEGSAVKLYSKYVLSPEDLGTVLNIVTAK